MTISKNKIRGTALITGANSGIGFETAYQLEQAGFRKVILACRTEQKGETARQSLLERGCEDVFETLAIDVSEANIATEASDKLISKGHKLDLLILNAGMVPGAKVVKNSQGVDLTFASTLIGHHALTVNLLSKGGINHNGRILIAGSEAARGDVPGTNLPDFDVVAKKDFNGNVHAMLKAYAEGSYPEKYVPMNAYAVAKLMVTWWAATLAKKLPPGVTVNAVSPGSVPATNFARDINWVMQNIMIPMMKLVGPLMGMAGPVSAAGKRYLEAADYGDNISGKFFASPPKKLVGKLEQIRTDLVLDVKMQAEGYKLIVELAGGVDFENS